MIKKCQDLQHDPASNPVQKPSKKSHSHSHPTHPRQQFTQKKLKPHLEGIERSTTESKSRTKSLLSRLFGKPERDLREQGAPRNKNQVYYDQHLEMVGQVFPNGNEFEDLHTVNIVFLVFLVITANTCAAMLIAYVFDYYFMGKWIQRACRKKLEKMTRVKEGFML